jgi:hypothetical protein
MINHNLKFNNSNTIIIKYVNKIFLFKLIFTLKFLNRFHILKNKN